MSVDEEYLSMWLINNYIGQCAQLCPFYISRLFDDVNTSVKLQKAVSEIVRWRSNTSLYDMWLAVEFAEIQISAAVSLRSVTAHSCVCWMNELTKIDTRFSVYFAAVALLHVARKISKNGFNNKLMDTLTTILRRNYSHCCGVLSLRKAEQNTSELVELLQKSAIEHLTTYRQLQYFGSIARIIATDFEALYAYKRGDYQRCLQLSTQNVHMLLYADHMPSVLILPEFIQLLDDDIVSLTALKLTVDPGCRDMSNDCCITQVTLSLYLMTQCQFKLRHLVTSLAEALNDIKLAQRSHARERTLDQLTLKLIERKIEMQHWFNTA